MTDASFLSKPVYIPSIEGSDIYNYMFRGREFEINYVGMIPTSLELNKLLPSGLKTTKKKTNDKLLSTDIINVKFKQKVNSGKSLIKRIKNKITNLDESKNEYRQKLEEFVDLIKTELTQDKWKEVSYTELREKFYTDGFTYNGVKYVVYKRSSAKSRIGQCLFIKEKLHMNMMKWSRMGIDFENANEEVDFPSLLAYESLVGSAIESAVVIKPENILIIRDVESKFTLNANVVRKGDNGYLDSFTEDTLIKNNLFDGESLLDSSYFPLGKSMMLLRNHMFKSAAFNCNVQQFLKSKCPMGTNYEDWKIHSMFDSEEVFAKDVHLITTPSSLKALKFSKLLGTERDMWEHWKDTISQDGCLFGVCKSEKKSKYGFDESGRVIQQTSYQMLNSMPMTKNDLEGFTSLEISFINRLKNDDQFFVDYTRSNSNDINCNLMFADLYLHNNDIAQTPIFKKFRKAAINSHVTHIKNGKVRLHGDYCVILGNPIEFLYHAIGELDEDNPASLSLQNNEAYTSMFDCGKLLTGFRNPHTSPSNVLVIKNTYIDEIEQYFNLSSNIVCVNAIKFPIQDILSGCDYDSDTLLLIDDERMLAISNKVFGQYKVCINHVASSKRKYNVCNYDMSIIDNQLSKSQRFIGRTVNLGQLCMSTYWDLISRGYEQSELSDLYKKIDVVTVLSGICIDLAKKMFEIDIGKEIEFIGTTKELKKEKPLFWKYVSQNDTIETCKYDCPMDYLYELMSNIDKADHKKDINLKDIILKSNIKIADRKQQMKIFSYVDSMCLKINNTYASNLSENERENRIDDTIKYYRFFIDKLKINPATMYSLLLKVSKNKKDGVGMRLMNVMYETQRERFLSAFITKNSTL